MNKYRIFLALGGKATDGAESNIWVQNLYEPLVNLGHDVHLFNIDGYFESGDRDKAIEQLSEDLPREFEKEHRRKPFDLFLSYLHERQIIPDSLKQIKRHVCTVNYTTNYHQFGIYRDIACIVDHNIYVSKDAKAGFDSIGATSHWMPFAANARFYKPSGVKNNQVVFVGSVYGPRPYLFWRLLQYGMDIQLYGPGWQELASTEMPGSRVKDFINEMLYKVSGYEIRRPQVSDPNPVAALRRRYDDLNESILQVLRTEYPANLHAPLSDRDYIRVLGEAGTVINIQESRFDHDFYNPRVLYCSNLRDFEATASGTFLCTQHSEELEQLFEAGKEVICYHNEHDLADKIKYYQAHDRQRIEIAEAGYKRTVGEHTWENRFRQLFTEIGFN